MVSSWLNEELDHIERVESGVLILSGCVRLFWTRFLKPCGKTVKILRFKTDCSNDFSKSLTPTFPRDFNEKLGFVFQNSNSFSKFPPFPIG